MEKKLTKKEMFARVIELLEGMVELEDKAELVEGMAHEISLIEKKAEKAKGYKRKKKEEADVIKDAVYAALGEDLKTIADITSEIEIEDISPAKVTARLTALVKEGLVVKEDVKIDKRTVKGYKLA